jgi:hypothetical protein
MTLARRLRNRLSQEAAQFIMRKECWEMVDELLVEREALKDEIERRGLEHARLNRDLVQKFVVYAMDPSDEVLDILIAALRDLEDEVARREEHAPA